MFEVLKLRLEMLEDYCFVEVALYVYVCIQWRSRSLPLYLLEDNCRSFLMQWLHRPLVLCFMIDNQD